MLMLYIVVVVVVAFLVESGNKHIRVLLRD